LPEKALRKYFEAIARINQKGYLVEDAHWANFYVEIDKASSWSRFFAGGECEIGMLDTDRIISMQDYVDGKAGGLGKLLAQHELGTFYYQGPNGKMVDFRVPSLKPIYENDVNKQLTLVLAKMNERSLDAYIRTHPGSKWPNGLGYFQEKMLELKGWVAYDPAINGLKDGVLGDTTIKLDLVKDYFPLINDSSRFTPFALSGGEAVAATGQRQRPSRRRTVRHHGTRHGLLRRPSLQRGVLARDLRRAA